MKKIFSLLSIIAFFGVAANEFSGTPEDIVGEWRSYILNRGEITFRSQYVYSFLPSGLWSIKEGKCDAVRQGWYKTERDVLFLQPLQAAQAKQNTAIKAFRKSKTTFELPNPIDEETGMIFIKADSIKKISLVDVVGKWQMTQKNLYTKESKTASFHLFFYQDLTYQVKQDGVVLPEKWATGTFEISDDLLVLKNQYSGTGLWDAPSFFLLDGKLKYNNSQYCLWCESVKDDR